MIRTSIYVLSYWLAALALLAMRPAFIVLAPPWISGFINLQMLQMAGILIGLLRGEIPGMAVAVISACLLGFSEQPGMLGASLVSFGVTAWLAGLLARHIRFQGFGFRWFTITLLLLIERFIWFSIRRSFWPDDLVVVQWLSIIATAVVGSWAYKIAARRIKLNLITNITI